MHTLFYKVDPALVKTILLLPALCRISQGKEGKNFHILRKFQNVMDQIHAIPHRRNSDPNAAKSQCIRFQPDIFLGDRHVETVVLLSQQKPDDTIEIDLDLDELDATSAELKATYQEIKDYVLKEFGLKVSSLYISQVKRKCGIEVGENYNLPKSENARVPQCPKEKEDAIKAALKYFAMI